MEIIRFGCSIVSWFDQKVNYLAGRWLIQIAEKLNLNKVFPRIVIGLCMHAR